MEAGVRTGLMPMNVETAKPDAKDLRQFGLLTGAILVILFGLLLPWLTGRGLPLWPWYISAPLVAAALLWPKLLGPVYHAWMRAGLLLGWINTRIILGLIFFLLFTPLGILFRIFGKDALRRKFDANADSYRIPAENRPPSHMENPF